MKASEVREMSIADLRERIELEKANLDTMKMNHTISPLEDTSKINKTRKDIARMMTILAERTSLHDANCIALAALVLLIVSYELCGLLYELAVHRVLLFSLYCNHDRLIHLVADHNTYSFLAKISFHENSIFSSVTLSQQELSSCERCPFLSC